MAGSSRGGVVRTLRRNVDLRIRTLEELVAGRRNPLDRRTAILQRRSNLVSAVGGRRSTTAGATDQSDEQTDTDEAEGRAEGNKADDPDIDLNDKVEIEVNSPTEEELRAANKLAEKHEVADAITVVDENRVRVESDPGTTFTVRVAEVLGRDVESSEPNTVSSGTPSMAEAVANKRGI